MAIEIWRNVSLGGAAAIVDVLAAGPLRNLCCIFSPLGFLGELGSFVELLLGATAAAFGAAGLVLCFGRKGHNLGATAIDEHSNHPNEEQASRIEDIAEPNAEVTIRLEDSFLRSLHRHRCVVTIHKPLGTAQSAGREVWYAKDR